MKRAIARLWRQIHRDLQAYGRLTPLLPFIAIIIAIWGLELAGAPPAVQEWVGIPLVVMALAWALYAKGHDFARLRRLSGASKFRSQWAAELRVCPDCGWDLPDDFDTSHGALNECPNCGALLDRMGHAF